MNSRLLSLLNRLLGRGKVTGTGDTYFTCPNCNHHKKKLAIQLNPNIKEFGRWRCWICNDFKGKTLFSLFRKLKVSDNDIKELADIIGHSYNENATDTKYEGITLPDCFIPLNKASESLRYKLIIKYLASRGISKTEIVRYGIGYCDGGKFNDMIIIPSYDKEGSLNFFSSRSYHHDSYIKHKNPEASKDVIGFELLINWNMPVLLCEGVFDAIAIRRNAIPLFGKTIPNKLLIQLIINKPPIVYLCLDNDAISDSIEIAEELMNNNISVSVVDLPDNEDPSSLGFKETWKLINKSESIGFDSLIKYKLNI